MTLTSDVEQIDPVTARVTVTVPAGTVAERLAAGLRRAASGAKVKGFRPGKVPPRMIEQLYGDRVRYDVTNELVSSSLESVVTERKLDLVGRPEVDSISEVSEDKDLTFSATCAVRPVPEIVGEEEIAVEGVYREEMTDARLDEWIDRFRLAHGPVEPVTDRRTAERGDVVTVKVEVVAGRQSLGRPEEITSPLDEPAGIPRNVADALVGKEIGSLTEVEARVSRDYRDKSLRGKVVTFKAELISLARRVPAPMDEALFKALGEEGIDSEEAFRDKVRSELEKVTEADAVERAQAKVVEFLVAKNPFPVPQAMVDDEIRDMLARGGVLKPDQALDPQRLGALRGHFGKAAEDRVRGTIIMDRLAEKHGVEVGDADVEKAIQDAASEHRVPTERLREYFWNPAARAGIVAELKRDKILEMLTKKASIGYTSVPEAGEPHVHGPGCGHDLEGHDEGAHPASEGPGGAGDASAG